MGSVLRHGTAMAAVLAAGCALVAPASAQTDTTAPKVTEATLGPAPNGMRAPWYRTAPTLTLTATDDVGVAKLEYSLDGGATYLALPVGAAARSVIGTVQIIKQGNTLIKFRAIDTAGNSSEVVNGARTTLTGVHRPGAGGSLRVASTAGIKAGDRLTLSTGVNGETVTVASVVTPDPPAPTPNVILVAPIRVQHANDATVVVQDGINVTLDSIAPILEHGLVAGPITTTSVLSAPPLGETQEMPAGASGSLRDPGGSSSGTGLNRPAYIQMYLDGQRINPAAINLYNLAAGAHAVRTWVNDAAGNSVWYTIGFNKTVAADGTHSISNIITSSEPTAHLTAKPRVTVTAMTPHPDAKYKVLVVTRGAGHQHVPDTTMIIQKLGAANGFNVDVFNPAQPAASVPTNPLLSVDTLRPYKAVIFNSTTGNTNFSPQEAFAVRDYLRGGGGWVGLHAATDCCRGTTEDALFLQSLTGGIFAGHPQGPFSIEPGCETCFWAGVFNEDPAHPATSFLPLRMMTWDELYNLDRNARYNTHVLQSLDEPSYAGNLNVAGRGPNMGDHPITWCQNIEGGRAFSTSLGHHRDVWYTDEMQRTTLAAIETAAGIKPANCISFREVREATAALVPAAAAVAAALVDMAYAAYEPAQRNYAGAVVHIDRLVALAQRPESGDAAARTALLAKGDDLRSWMVSLGARPVAGAR